MAEVTVKQLADEVGTPVERLLQQMQELLHKFHPSFELLELR